VTAKAVPQRKGCGHPDDACRYVLWHARAETRDKAGQRQTRCPRCKLWRWPSKWTGALQDRMERAADAAAKRESRSWAASFAKHGRPPQLTVARTQRKERHAAAVPCAANQKFLILSNHRPNGNPDMTLWWRPKGAGYTVFLDEAGRYTKEAALQIVRGSRTDNSIVSEAVAMKRSRAMVRLEDLPNYLRWARTA